MRRRAAALALAALLLGSAPALAQGRFSFAVVGDTPYLPLEEVAFAASLATLDAQPLAFVVHVGDIKAGATPCDDALFAERRALFDASAHPFVLVPGDNEWTDCYASGFDPIERLGALRQTFHAGGASLGQRRMALSRQSVDPRFAAYREHVRWTHGTLLFVALNVPGSNNNLGRTAAMDAEHRRRMAAVFEWLDASIALATRDGLAGVVMFLHADPGFGGTAQRRRGAPDGYAELRGALQAHAQSFARPILLVHGDGHRFRLDHPLADAGGERLARFTRLEVPGAPAAAPVVVDVDASAPEVFRVRPLAGQEPFPGNP